MFHDELVEADVGMLWVVSHESGSPSGVELKCHAHMPIVLVCEVKRGYYARSGHCYGQLGVKSWKVAMGSDVLSACSVWPRLLMDGQGWAKMASDVRLGCSQQCGRRDYNEA